MKSLKLNLKETKTLRSNPERIETRDRCEERIGEIRKYVKALETSENGGTSAGAAVSSAGSCPCPFEWYDSFPKKWYRCRRKKTVSTSILFEIGCHRFNQAVIERHVALETKDPLKAARYCLYSEKKTNPLFRSIVNIDGADARTRSRLTMPIINLSCPHPYVFNFYWFSLSVGPCVGDAFV